MNKVEYRKAVNKIISEYNLSFKDKRNVYSQVNEIIEELEVFESPEDFVKELFEMNGIYANKKRPVNYNLISLGVIVIAVAILSMFVKLEEYVFFSIGFLYLFAISKNKGSFLSVICLLTGLYLLVSSFINIKVSFSIVILISIGLALIFSGLKIKSKGYHHKNFDGANSFSSNYCNLDNSFKENYYNIANSFGEYTLDLRNFDFTDFTVEVVNSLGEVKIIVDNDTAIDCQISNSLGHVYSDNGNIDGSKNLLVIGSNSLGEVKVKAN